jgi:hypothetical protein
MHVLEVSSFTDFSRLCICFTRRYSVGVIRTPYRVRQPAGP